MKKKIREKISKFTVLFLLIALIISLIPVLSFAGEYDEIVNSYIESTQKYIEIAKNNPTDENIKQAINEFYSLDMHSSQLLNYTDYIIQNHKALLDVIDSLSENKSMEYITLMFKTATNKNDYYIDISSVTLFSKYPALKDLLPDEYNKLLLRHPNTGNQIQVDYTPGMPSENPTLPSSQEYTDKFKDNPNYGNETYSDINYYTSDGKCYKKTTIYKGSRVISVEDIMISETVVGCGYSGWGNSGLYTPSNETYIGATADELEYDVLEPNDESNLTLQYTLTKNSDYPIFYDSGIRVSLENNIKYSQIKDVMYQVTTKQKGQFIEDVDQFMALIDNKLFIYKDQGEISYNKFEDLFLSFPNVEVKALDTKIGTVCSLTDYLEIRRTSKILLNGEETTLTSQPIISHNTSIFPIEEFANLLGATSEKSQDKVIVKANNNTLVYENQKDFVIVNGLKVTLPTETKFNSNNVLMAYIYPMLDKLDYDMIWNPDTLTLEVNKK